MKRELINETQQMAAARIGISKSAYCNKEQQKVPFSDREKIVVATAYGFTEKEFFDFFFGGKPNFAPEEDD